MKKKQRLSRPSIQSIRRWPSYAVRMWCRIKAAAVAFRGVLAATSAGLIETILGSGCHVHWIPIIRSFRAWDFTTFGRRKDKLSNWAMYWKAWKTFNHLKMTNVTDLWENQKTHEPLGIDWSNTWRFAPKRGTGASLRSSPSTAVASTAPPRRPFRRCQWARPVTRWSAIGCDALKKPGHELWRKSWERRGWMVEVLVGIFDMEL